VISILGILAGIAVPKVTSIKNKADISVVKSDLRSIQTALEIYAMDNSNKYPTDQSNFETIEFNDPEDYTYNTNTDKNKYLVYYTNSIEGTYYYIKSIENGIKSDVTAPTL
jgi:general secretion pathway protein G